MKPLTGLKVLDLTIGNPYAGSLFADYGAQVVKIEDPCRGDPIRYHGAKPGENESIYQNYYNRGKQSVTINLNDAKGADLIKKMISQFDMLCANVPEKQLVELGLSYAELKELNPKLIYGILTPFGEQGPWKDYPDYDLIVMARASLLDRTGMPEKPTRLGFPLAYYYGSWHLTAGMMAAYLGAQCTGEGSKVSVSCWQAVMSVDETSAPCLYGMNELPVRLGNGFPTTNPTDTFRCKNGWFALSIGSDPQWWAFSKAAGRQDWIDDPRYSCDPARSLENYFGDLDQQLKDYFLTITIEEADEICRAAMVPGAPCNTVKELISDEQVKARNMILSTELPDGRTVMQFGYPIKFSRDADNDDVIADAPPLGRDTRTVLSSLAGLSEDEMNALHCDAVI